MTVSIVTHSQDREGISSVIEAIAAEGGEAFRAETFYFPLLQQFLIAIFNWVEHNHSSK